MAKPFLPKDSSPSPATDTGWFRLRIKGGANSATSAAAAYNIHRLHLSEGHRETLGFCPIAGNSVAVMAWYKESMRWRPQGLPNGSLLHVSRASVYDLQRINIQTDST